MQKLNLVISAGIITLGVAAQGGQKLQLKSGSIDTTEGKTAQVFLSNSQIQTSYQIIQFKAPIRLQDQEWLKSIGVEVLRYIPDDAYVARLTELKSLKDLGHSDLIQTVLAYEPEFRLNHKAIALSVFNENKNQNLHVRVFKGVELEAFENKLKSISGLNIQEKTGGAFIVSVPSASARDIAKLEGVEWVDIHRIHNIHKMDVQQFKPHEDPFVSMVLDAEGDLENLTGYESGTKLMKFEPAWKRGLTGKGQIVTVADTGLDTGKTETLNLDFSGLVRPFIGGIHSTTWGDPNGHGTHVAGSAVGKGLSSKGVLKGGAYGAGLIMESMYSELFGTLTIGPDPTPLFKAAYEEGSRIHSNSWGSITDKGIYDDTARSVDEFMFENPDMLILFSAGNEGIDANQDGRVDKGSVTAPSTAKNALTVGASENLVAVGGIQLPLGEAGSSETGFRWPAEPIASDTLSNNPKGLAAFSGRGPTDDGRLKPDVVAPGTNILSSCSKYTGAGTLWGGFNKDLCYSGGTSMSTPLVAGAAALVRQNLMEKRGMKAPSASLIKATLMHTAIDLYPGQYGEVGRLKGQELLKPGPNADQGYGRVDVSKAVSVSVKLVDEKEGLATDETKEITLPDGTKKVTLVYTDAPGSTAAQKALVNNLDIAVTTSTGAVFVSDSKINNSEQLIIPAGSKGLKLIVKGMNIPMGKDGRQPYSVVYSK